MSGFKWSNLKLNKCPKCSKSWTVANNVAFGNDNLICKCGFKIGTKRMQEIVSDKIDKEILESLGRNNIENNNN